MSKIATLDKKALVGLRPDIDAALKELGERLGLTFRAGNGSYGDGATASFKLEIKVDDPRAQADQERAIFNRNCGFLGLRPEDLNTTFVVGRETLTLIGIEPKKIKYPFKCRKADGKVMLYTDAIVERVRAATDAKAKAA